MAPVGEPIYDIAHLSQLTTFTVGIPAFFLTLWARPQRLQTNLLLAVAIYVVDYRSLLTSPLTSQDEAWAVTLFESYTGVEAGTAGYSNAVATVLAQGSVSMFISWTACLLILFLEPPSRFFLGWRTEVSPERTVWRLQLFERFLERRAT